MSVMLVNPGTMSVLQGLHLTARAAELGLNPKDERYTLAEDKARCLKLMRLERYTLDTAACPEAHLAPRWFGLQADGRFIDGLARVWRGDVWCNPPFSQWAFWVMKVWEEWDRGRCRSISLLLPNDKTEQYSWQQLIAPHRDRRGSPLRMFELTGRTRFSAPGLNGKPIPSHQSPHGTGSPYFGCYLLGWHRRFLRGSP